MEKGVPDSQKDMGEKMKPQGGADSGKDKPETAMDALKGLVEKIKTAVEKIEPKLPQQVLA